VYQNTGLIVNVDSGAAVAKLHEAVSPVVLWRVAKEGDFAGLVERADIHDGLNDGMEHVVLSLFELAPTGDLDAAFGVYVFPVNQFPNYLFRPVANCVTDDLYPVSLKNGHGERFFVATNRPDDINAVSGHCKPISWRDGAGIDNFRDELGKPLFSNVFHGSALYGLKWWQRAGIIR
jgi:hypothetical protein